MLVKSYKNFEREEILYIILGFLVPIFLSELPYWENLILQTENICYMFNQKDQDIDHKALTILSSIVCWDGLIALYIIYSIIIGFQLRNIHDDHETYEAVKDLKRTVKSY